MSARRAAIRLTREADRDFADIGLYTSRVWGSAQYASYRAAITQVLRSVRDHPALGQIRDDLFPGCRSINVEHHIIYYHPQESEIVVLRILRGRQDPTDKVKQPRS
jgi:toxin ParE1/3/4